MSSTSTIACITSTLTVAPDWRLLGAVLQRRTPGPRISWSRILSIGERTVQTHLSNVLSKLGLTSRTQAALWAVREGLTGP